MKERSYRTVFKEKNTDVETVKEKISCENMYRVTNEDTPENQAEWVDDNGKIYNSIFTFKEDAPIEKNGLPLWKKNNMGRKGVQHEWTINEGMIKNKQTGVPWKPSF